MDDKKLIIRKKNRQYYSKKRKKNMKRPNIKGQKYTKKNQKILLTGENQLKT